MKTMLKLNDINVYYGAIHAIKGISLEVTADDVAISIPRQRRQPQQADSWSSQQRQAPAADPWATPGEEAPF